MQPHGGGSGAGVPEGVRLTGRERAVLRMIVERYGNQDIADRLVISKRTVESHVATLLDKFAVPDRRALIAAAGPSSFRTALTDTLRTATDPIELLTRAAELVGRHLVAHRAYYQEFDHADGTFTIHRDFCDGVPSIAGTYVLADFSDDPVEHALRTGDPMVVRDSAELAPRAAATWSALSVRAAVAAPTMRDGVCVAGLAVNSAHPRDWTDEDVALLVETAERTWAHVERLRLEKELHETERRFRTLADSVPALVWQTDADGSAVFASRSFLDHTGLADDPVDGLPWEDVVRFDSDGDASHGYREAVQRRSDWDGRVVVRRHDGVWQDFDGRVTPRFDGDGAYLGLLCVCHEPR
jgi:PAS domain S-box-containing protein